MVNLYWKNNGLIKDVEERPFINEAAFETFIFENQNILGGDISIIHRQIRSGTKDGIPDMIGIDTDNRICIIELKNVEANEDIVPQALQYAIWAETNPDSIKSLWLESKNKSEDLKPDWDNLDIRILLVAPGFRQNVLKMSKKINYPVELYKVRRYGISDDEFISVEVLELDEKKIISTKAKEDWTWEFYEKEHSKESMLQFKNVVQQIEDYCKKQNWNLPYNLNKYYTGFKSGTRVVFCVAWGAAYTWNVKFKISDKDALAFKSDNWEYQRYDYSFKEALFKAKDPENADIKELDILFKKAYEGK